MGNRIVAIQFNCSLLTLHWWPVEHRASNFLGIFSRYSSGWLWQTRKLSIFAVHAYLIYLRDKLRGCLPSGQISNNLAKLKRAIAKTDLATPSRTPKNCSKTPISNIDCRLKTPLHRAGSRVNTRIQCH